MKISILYFAGLREKLGVASESLDVPVSVSTVDALRVWLIGEGRTALATAKNVRCAVNQNMAGPETPIGEGSEVAFFPPVTGG